MTIVEASHESGKRSSRRSGRGPTIADVARAAMVSQMTVSRVVNREANVNAETRERVLRTIDELGYVPNQAARMLAGARQCRIALVHDNPSAAWLSAVLVACLDEALAEGVQLLVERSDGGGSAAALVRQLTSHRIDAVVLPPPLGDDDALLAALRDAGIPSSLVATGYRGSNENAVGIDEAGAAQAITGLLISAGHRRIGMILGNPSQRASAQRRDGYFSALDAAGIPRDMALVETGDFSYRSGFAAAERLLTREHRPTAIFASNDDMAAAVIAVAHRAGIDVPRELSVCGFDDTAMATSVWPELTTVHVPIGEIARKATAMAIAAARSGIKAQPAHVELPWTLVERASVVAPG